MTKLCGLRWRHVQARQLAVHSTTLMPLRVAILVLCKVAPHNILLSKRCDILAHPPVTSHFKLLKLCLLSSFLLHLPDTISGILAHHRHIWSWEQVVVIAWWNFDRARQWRNNVTILAMLSLVNRSIATTWPPWSLPWLLLLLAFEQGAIRLGEIFLRSLWIVLPLSHLHQHVWWKTIDVFKANRIHFSHGIPRHVRLAGSSTLAFLLNSCFSFIDLFLRQMTHAELLP